MNRWRFAEAVGQAAIVFFIAVSLLLIASRLVVWGLLGPAATDGHMRTAAVAAYLVAGLLGLVQFRLIYHAREDDR